MARPERDATLHWSWTLRSVWNLAVRATELSAPAPCRWGFQDSGTAWHNLSCMAAFVPQCVQHMYDFDL